MVKHEIGAHVFVEWKENLQKRFGEILEEGECIEQHSGPW